MRRRHSPTSAALTSILLAGTIALGAEPPTGRMLVDAASIESARPRLTPGLEWCIRRGWTLDVRPPQRIEIPRAVRQATEKYAAQVALVDGGANLGGYVAGLPFPILDPTDPDVAVKIVWNHLLSWRATDDLRVSKILAESGVVDGDGRFHVETRFVIPSYQELSFVGRLYVEPAPLLDERTPLARAAVVHSFREPVDLRNTALLRHRYADGSRDDDLYAYFASSRRVRRLPGVDSSEAPFGQDVDLDSVWGYSGRVADLDWRFLGEREILAAVHGRHVPVRWSETGFGFDDEWEPRRVFVVEGTPKRRGYEYGRRILYVDRESFAIVHSEIYDRGGELWKVWVNLTSYLDAGGRSASAADGAFPRHVAFVMVDVRASRATRVAMPAPDEPGSGWVVNAGPAEGAVPAAFYPAALARRSVVD